MAIALLPVLVLGAAQSVMAFRTDAQDRRDSLLAAAQRSATLARNRVENASVVLETLTPETIGFQCAPRLANLLGRVEDYANLVRFDDGARVACAASTVKPDPRRREWFIKLRDGQDFIVTSAPAGIYSDEPAVVAAVRAVRPDGTFDGALAAVIKISSLRPDLREYSLPEGTEVALVDGEGRYLIRSQADAFTGPPPASYSGPVFYEGQDAHGGRRIFATAPLVGPDVRLVLSSPSPGLFSWARLNPLSTVLLPLTAFFIALISVWIVADRVVLRWLAYLQRIAAIYAKGRFTVRASQVEHAPPEFRELGHTLDAMAAHIIARDATLLDNLAQKDDLMREIHHRVKNNLQVISSLLNMQQRALTDPAARAAMSDTRQRISAIALIYRALYQGPDLKKVDLRPFLEELTAQLLASEGPLGGVRTEFHADELIVDPDKLAPLALFAVEAISSAQKHALREGGGTLRVNFTVDGDEARLEISDDGAAGPLAPIEGGVGRTLMTAFARQLRGTAEVAANAEGGITSRLVFPTPEAGAASEPPAPPHQDPGTTGGNQAAA